MTAWRRRSVTHVLGRNAYEVDSASSRAGSLADGFDRALWPHPHGHPDAGHGRPGNRREAACHRRLRFCPIVALTAESSAETRRLCLESGMRGFVTKPIHAEELLHAISFALS